MAKAAKPAKPGKAKEGKGGGKSLIWLQGLACGALAALAPATALQAAILLLPAIIAAALESAPGKPIARAVLLCGLAACVEPVRALWNTGQALGASLSVGADFQTVAVAWSAAAGGWLLTQLLPIGAGAVLNGAAATRISELKATRAALVAEWGLDETPADQ